MHPDNPNLPYWWSALLGFFSLLSLQDYVFILGAIISAFFTIKTYYAKRKDEQDHLKEEQKRTKILQDYLKEASLRPEKDRPAAAKVAAEMINRIER